MAGETADIYLNLPKTDCGECGFEKCMDFATHLVRGEDASTDDVYKCPYMQEEDRQAVILILEGYFK